MTIDEQKHKARAEALNSIAKLSFTVEEAMNVWGFSSKASAVYELDKLIELGLVVYEKRPGYQYGRYYLK